ERPSPWRRRRGSETDRRLPGSTAHPSLDRPDRCASILSATSSPPLFAERDYIATRKVRYVVLDFAVVNLHKQALKASEAAACARERGKSTPSFGKRSRLFSRPSR